MPLKKTYERMIRVDLAGERGACYVYAGQIWACALARKNTHPIAVMYQEEIRHALLFEALKKEYKVTATKLDILWCTLGWSLGVLTALGGTSSRMTCTTAIEDVIALHYEKQIKMLPENDPLAPFLRQCQEDELHHAHQAQEHGGKNEGPLYQAIRVATRFAIWASERI